CCTSELAQTSGNSLGQDGAEWRVARSGSLDALAQGCHVSIGCTVNGGHADFCGNIHQRLVTAGGYTVGELFDRIRVIDLVLANLVLESEQNPDGFCCGKWQVRSICSSGAASWCGGWCWCLCHRLWLGRRDGLGIIRGRRSGFTWGFRRCGRRGGLSFLDVEGGSWCFLDILEHDLVLVAVDVEDREVRAGDIHGALGQVGQRWGCRATDFDDLVYFFKEQLLGFNPAHR